MILTQAVTRSLVGIPINLPSVFAWWEASKETTFSDGDIVNTLTDFKNGHNLDATGHAPTYETDEVNGKPVFRFVGSDYAAHNTAATWKWMHDGTSRVVYLVVGTETADSGNQVFFFGSTSYGTGQIGANLSWEDRDGASRSQLMNGRVVKGVPGTPLVDALSAQGSLTSGEFTILEYDFEYLRAGDDMILRKNGVKIAGTESTPTPDSGNPDYPFWIGPVYQIPLTADADFAAGILLKDPTDNHVKIIRNYLSSRYNIAT
ncbi:hypothetical protein KAR91_56470 [Candidatus Pacearchaeota archaeon]|nr:hypothetical protein [Candidatus Pacearchaeota archaeon]